MSNEIPRRIRIDQNTPEELLIRDAIDAVESLGAHEKLTDCVVALSDALSHLADFIDSK